jgi:hypothetical protein
MHLSPALVYRPIGLLVLALVCGFLMVGCESPEPPDLPTRDSKNKLPDQTWTVIDSAPEITLISLSTKRTSGAKAILGWKTLGETVLSQESRRELLSALDRGLTRPGKGGAKAFRPRHAIRASDGVTTVELLMSFECGWVYVFIDGKERARVLLNPQQQAPFDKALKAAGVPLTGE